MIMEFEQITDEELATFVARSDNGRKRKNIATFTKPGQSKWPMRKMRVGDVVTVKRGEYGDSNPQIYAHSYGKQSGKKFATKEIAPETYRIVRIA